MNFVQQSIKSRSGPDRTGPACSARHVHPLWCPRVQESYMAYISSILPPHNSNFFNHWRALMSAHAPHTATPLETAFKCFANTGITPWSSSSNLTKAMLTATCFFLHDKTVNCVCSHNIASPYIFSFLHSILTVSLGDRTKIAKILSLWQTHTHTHLHSYFFLDLHCYLVKKMRAYTGTRHT